MNETPDPVGPVHEDCIVSLFSPRKTMGALDWYCERMDDSRDAFCLTAAFGVNPMLAEVLEKDKDYLRYLLLEKRGNNYEVYSKDRDTQVAVGSKFKEDYLYRWTREKLTDFNFHVRYVHTKYMLVDPLSDKPTVITGSANFSEQSTRNNDENMLVIHGDTRVADIYLGEFFRLFFHFYFRYIVDLLESEDDSEDRKRAYLKPDDSWTRKYYEEGSIKEKQRIFFGRDIRIGSTYGTGQEAPWSGNYRCEQCEAEAVINDLPLAKDDNFPPCGRCIADGRPGGSRYRLILILP
jgi:phosphatidylserine/phosphatidylglycerophosphate/cardiolipin synthase-like enzyme